MYKTVFITDDDEDDRDFIIEAINALSETITQSFKNGLELIDYLMTSDEPNPNLIVLDLNMPIKDGYTTLKEIKEIDKLKEIEVVILTSSSNPHDEKLCMKLGAHSFINKPFSMEGYKKLGQDILKILGV